MNKLFLIYDASPLYDGAYKTSSRSGIYFCALNVLKELFKLNIEISLYCSPERLPEVIDVLHSEFSGIKYNLISDIPQNSFMIFYQNIKYKRRKVKIYEKNICIRFIKKTILKLFILFLTPLYRLVTWYVKKNLKMIDYSKYVFLSSCYPVNNIFEKCKKFIILHDTIPIIMPEKNPMALKNSWYSTLLEGLNGQDFYLANSENTRKDFLKYYPQIDANKIRTVLHACGAQYEPKELSGIYDVKKKYNIPYNKKYIFSLCTLEPRKNLIRTVRTFIEFIKKYNIDDLVFVLGGGHWDLFISQLEDEIESLGDWKNKIIRTGYVDDKDLPFLYSGAEWFVYTSQYEGFGVPPLEAMSCKCPVVVSNNSSLPEVVGKAGLLIDWDSDEQHIDAYYKYYYDKELRNKFAQEGFKRSQEFSWEKSTEQILEFILEMTEKTKESYVS